MSSIVRHLCPLAIAANVVQATHCRLDTVLLTFGSLYLTYSTHYIDPNDEGPCQAILKSIEKRWAKADQDLFIAAVYLNPFYTNPNHHPIFAPLDELKCADIQQLLIQLWHCFYNHKPPSTFLIQMNQYFGQTGFFASLQSQCLIEASAADVTAS